jgi:hypothetical protein
MYRRKPHFKPDVCFIETGADRYLVTLYNETIEEGKNKKIEIQPEDVIVGNKTIEDISSMLEWAKMFEEIPGKSFKLKTISPDSTKINTYNIKTARIIKRGTYQIMKRKRIISEHFEFTFCAENIEKQIEV